MQISIATVAALGVIILCNGVEARHDAHRAIQAAVKEATATTLTPPPAQCSSGDLVAIATAVPLSSAGHVCEAYGLSLATLQSPDVLELSTNCFGTTTTVPMWIENVPPVNFGCSMIYNDSSAEFDSPNDWCTLYFPTLCQSDAPLTPDACTLNDRRIFASNITFSEAGSFCEGQGMRLANITNSEIPAYSALLSSCGQEVAWTGLNGRMSECATSVGFTTPIEYEFSGNNVTSSMFLANYMSFYPLETCQGAEIPVLCQRTQPEQLYLNNLDGYYEFKYGAAGTIVPTTFKIVSEQDVILSLVNYEEAGVQFKITYDSGLWADTPVMAIGEVFTLTLVRGSYDLNLTVLASPFNHGVANIKISKPYTICPNAGKSLSIITTAVPFPSAQQACLATGSLLATMTNDNITFASSLLYACAGANAAAYIGSYEGNATTCLTLDTGSTPGGGAVSSPSSCVEGLPIVCQTIHE